MTKHLPCPTVMRLLINYDSATGVMTWRKRAPWSSNATKNNHCPLDVTNRFNERYCGKPALSAEKGNGYLYGTIKGKNILAHRAAWCVFYGYWPNNLIDHINGKRSDNKINNLRDVSGAENNRNRIAAPKGKYYGVIKSRSGKRWVARLNSYKKYLWSKTFDNIEDAIAARKEAEKRVWKNEK